MKWLNKDPNEYKHFLYIIIYILMSRIFTDCLYFRDDTALIPNIEVSGMTIQQSIDAPVTLRNTMTLSGNISTQNGNGNFKNI